MLAVPEFAVAKAQGELWPLGRIALGQVQTLDIDYLTFVAIAQPRGNDKDDGWLEGPAWFHLEAHSRRSRGPVLPMDGSWKWLTERRWLGVGHAGRCRSRASR